MDVAQKWGLASIFIFVFRMLTEFAKRAVKHTKNVWRNSTRTLTACLNIMSLLKCPGPNKEKTLPVSSCGYGF